VFPDIYHRNLVSLARARAILQKDGLVSRVNMKEVARIVRLHSGYPQPLHVRTTPAKKPKPKKPSKNATSKATSWKPPKSAGARKNNGGAKPPASKSVLRQQSRSQPAPQISPGIPPGEIARIRSQWSLLLARFRMGQVKLVNERRDLVQLEQLSAHGFLLASDKRVLSPALHLGQALARLANHTTKSKPLEILSIYRAPSASSPQEPHANGLAADISAFGGHIIHNRRPSEALAGVIAVVQTLPLGQYRLGLPKPPGTEPQAFLPPPDRPGNWPFLPAPIPRVGQIGALTLVLPHMVGAVPALDEHGRYRPEVMRWANEHSAPRSDLGDPRLRKALAQSARNGVEIVMVFPDAADHLHLDVLPAKASGPMADN